MGAAEALLGEPAGTAAPRHEPTFQPYIFWAYGIACGLLCLFTIWTIREVGRLTKKVDYLAGRLDRARLGEGGAAADPLKDR
jgi:hypothetical protein